MIAVIAVRSFRHRRITVQALGFVRVMPSEGDAILSLLVVILSYMLDDV